VRYLQRCLFGLCTLRTDWTNSTGRVGSCRTLAMHVFGPRQPSCTSRELRRWRYLWAGVVAFIVMNTNGSQWNDLVPFLVQYCRSAPAAHRESVLRIFGSLAEWFGGKMAPMAEEVRCVQPGRFGHDIVPA
jgi:hypothetical protein